MNLSMSFSLALVAALSMLVHPCAAGAQQEPISRSIGEEGSDLRVRSRMRGRGTAIAGRTATPTWRATPTATPSPDWASEELAPFVASAEAAAASSVIRVPADVADLQTAISQVPTGGIIELANGTYPSPVGGFRINDRVGFTIRAAAGATVVLDGGGTRDLLRLINTSVGAGGPVNFERLTFANGRSTTDGAAGGVTLHRARATFTECTFQDNRSDAPSTGGGGMNIAINSTVYFFDCTWTGNIAKHYGGGIAVQQDSVVSIHRGTFLDNRTNAPNHSVVAAGGAIHVGNSILRVSNSRFEGNRAGYAGGGIYAIGTWLDPVTTLRADVLIVNSTFVNNQAARDASVSFPVPTEAGAVHIEDQARGRIYNSRFSFNSAHTGGAVNTYRGILEIEQCFFEGNRATGTGSSNGFGGAIMGLSSDANDATTGGGTINRRSAMLTVRDTLIRGRSGAVTTVGQIAGGIYITGDVNRIYGLNGVSQQGSLASNRATLVLDRVAIVDCDVTEVVSAVGSGVAGGLMTSTTTLTMTNSLVINNDAVGTTNASGGGMALIDQTAATITGTTIARNSASQYGGGMFVQGSSITMDSCRLIANEVSPGVSETVGQSYGAAILAGPSEGQGLPVTGTISNSIFSSNIGLPIFDDDRTNGPINDVRYNGNQIYSTTFGTTVYTNSIAGQCCKTVAQLNSLVVTRNNGTSTDKVAVNNTVPGSAPVVGAILAVPPAILPINAVGDPAPPTASYLAYAWSGGSATLNGNSVSGNAGLSAAPGTGTHTLNVAGTSFNAAVGLGAEPSVVFSANPTSISSGASSLLSWSTLAGTFVDGAIDQGVTSASTAAGSVSVSPLADTTYRRYEIMKEGGAVDTAAVSVTGAEPVIASFTTSPVIVNPGGTAQLAWSVSPGSTLTVNGTSGTSPSGTRNVQPTGSTTYTLWATNSFGSSSASVRVNVNGGTATLGNPSVTQPSAGQVLSVSGVTFSWTSVGGAAMYDVRVWDASNGATLFTGALAGAGSTGTLISLPNGSYVVGVRACTATTPSDGACGAFGTRQFSISLLAPAGAPTITAPTAGATLTSSVQTLRWTAVSGSGQLPLSYEIELVDVSTGLTELTVRMPSNFLSTITALRSGQFRMRVRACEAGCGPYSGTVQFTANVPAAPSTAPTITQATVNGSNQLSAQWTAVSGAEWYELYVVQPPPAGPGGGALTVAARQVFGTSVTVVLPVGAANAIVRACSGNGCGAYSASTAVNPVGPNPNAPQLGQPLAGAVVNGPVVMFTWSRVPGDNGSNTVYRLYAQDLSRGTTALDVQTTNNFYAAYFNAEGARYDALVFARPGTAQQVMGPVVGFNVRGVSPSAPTMVAPTHQGAVAAGNLQVGWTPLPGASLYEYFVAVPGQTGAAYGVTPGTFVQVPLGAVGGQPTLYSAIARACPAGATCVLGSDTGWGPWSVSAGMGDTSFTVVP